MSHELLLDPASPPRECVTRGAAWLDTIKPDWYRSVDVENLYLHTMDKCICGYVFKDEAEAADRGESGYSWAYRHYGRQWFDSIPESRREVASTCGWMGFTGTETTGEMWRMEIAHRYALNAEVTVS